MADHEFRGANVESYSGTCAAAATVTIEMNGQFPATVMLFPDTGGGGSMTLKARATAGGELEEVDPDNLTYTADAIVVIDGPVHELVIGAATGDGDYQVAA